MMTIRPNMHYAYGSQIDSHLCSSRDCVCGRICVRLHLRMGDDWRGLGAPSWSVSPLAFETTDRLDHRRWQRSSSPSRVLPQRRPTVWSLVLHCAAYVDAPFVSDSATNLNPVRPSRMTGTINNRKVLSLV